MFGQYEKKEYCALVNVGLHLLDDDDTQLGEVSPDAQHAI